MLKPSKSCSAPIYSLQSNYQISNLHPPPPPTTTTHTHTQLPLLTFCTAVTPCQTVWLVEMWVRYLWVKGQRVCECAFSCWYYTQCLGMATAAAGGHKKKTKIRERNREWMMEWVFGETSLKRVTGRASREDRTVLKQRRKCVTQGRVSVCVCCVFE